MPTGQGADSGNNRKTRYRTLGVDDEFALQTSLSEARERLLSGGGEGFRTLYRGSRGEIQETDLASGHKLRVHKLLVTP